MNEIDFSELRKDLINYFGTAVASGFLVAMVELTEVERASNQELINIAIKNNFDIANYIKEEPKKYKLL